MNGLTDRCDASASGSEGDKTRWTKGDQELVLCAHHGRKHGPKLHAEGWKVR